MILATHICPSKAPNEDHKLFLFVPCIFSMVLQTPYLGALTFASSCVRVGGIIVGCALFLL
jgi:hypothetical protein